MKYKSKTLNIKRAREEKIKKIQYFGYVLPMSEGLIEKRYAHNN